MKKHNAASKFDPAVPVSGHDHYVDSIVANLVAKAPVPMGEFEAPEFSIEPVKGARAFDVDKLGRLRGVTYDQVWKPGENVATCQADAMTMQSLIAYPGSWYGRSAGGSHPVVPITRYTTGVDAFRKPKPPHGLVGCKCGFYGYYDGSNDYHKPERISAVVEGYGEVVIGTRGFRATKARIVALTIPDTVSPALAMRVRRNYHDIPFLDTFEAMVTAYPTDSQNGPTPESDPDFWTRS